ncbi:vWA domain-containing protein [Rhizobium sp. BR 314]|uniref:vWA domain-containing protein n=1 Tax=Rhizobium sp. BR 314 TaxID=3040013 RepID=UPI0039BF3AB1
MMISGSDILRTFGKLLRNSSGNFGILTAVAIPVLVAAGGVGIDIANMSLSRSQLQEATDAAALGTATALANGSATTANAKDLANKLVLGQMSNYLSGDAGASDALKAGTSTAVTSTSNSSGGTSYTVAVNSSYTMSVSNLSHLLGLQSMTISASSSTTSGTAVQKTALSMEIVLDKSGSMWLDTETIDKSKTRCDQYYIKNDSLYKYKNQESPCYVKKIDALRTAAGNLLDQLDAADPKSQFVRTAGIAWSSQVDISNELGWGTGDTRDNVIDLLAAGGGTESTAPMQLAYSKLTSSTEAGAQNSRGNKTFDKIIVFMTDGDNNSTSSDTTTLSVCKKAKEQGMQIYTVAFMAPDRGQNLLKSCASSSSNYFDARQMTDLVAAFKTIGAQAVKQMTLLTR